MNDQHDPLTPHNPNLPRRLKFFSTVNTVEEKATVQVPVVNGNGARRLQFIVPASVRESKPLKRPEIQQFNETGQRQGGPPAMVVQRGTSGRLKTPGRWVPGSFGF